MKTLSATLADLVAQRVLAIVPYVSIAIVEDHDTQQLKAPIQLSTAAFQKIVGTDPQAPELPFLERITFPVETMSHLPTLESSGANTLQRRIAFSLINAPYEDADLYAWLTDTGRLDRALLEFQWLILPADELGFGLNDEHRLFVDGAFTDGETLGPAFSGEIDRVVSVGSTIEIQGKTLLPEVDWKIAPADADPRDAGLRLPVPLGSQGIVRCINLVVGAQTTLLGRLPIGGLDPVPVDVSNFPSSGSAMFGAEVVKWTGITDGQLTGVTRGDRGTTEADHIVGTPIVVLSDVTLGVASSTIASVTRLFLRSPVLNTTIEVSKLAYSIDYDDEATAPGSSGDPITTAQLTAAQLRSLLHDAYADAAVIQQPFFQDDAQFDEFTANDDFDLTDTTTVTTDAGATGTWSGVGTASPSWVFAASGGSRESLHAPFVGAGSLNPLQGLASVTFQLQIDVNTLSTPITIGLIATGGEGILEGFTDGMIVASVEITATGANKVIQGGAFSVVEGTNADALDAIQVDLVLSEIKAIGSPAIQFGVDHIRLEIDWLDDIEEVTEAFINPRTPDDLTTSLGITSYPSPGSRTFDGPWTNLADGQTPSQTVDGGAGQFLRAEIDTDPIAGSPLIIALKFHFKTTDHREGSGDQDEGFVQIDFLNDFSEWSSLFTSTGAFQRIHDCPGGADTTTDSLIDMTSLLVAGATTADMVGGLIQVKAEVDADAPESNSTSQLDEFWFEITFKRKKTVSTGPLRTVDSQIQAAAGGVGLEFFAVCDGPVAPDATYDEANGDLIFHPSDLVRYWLQKVGGISASDVDDTTFDAAVTNLGGYVWGFDARNLGGTWETILLRMGVEARANICQPGYGDWQMQTALNTFAFPAPAATIDSHGEMQSIGKDDSEIETRLTVFFAFDPRLEAFDNRSFAGVQLTDPAAAEVIAREVEFGRKDADPLFLFCHTAAGATGVTDWRKYMEHELGRFARVMTGRVDHWQGLVLELGDIVTLELVNGAVTESVKARVIEAQPGLATGFVVRFAEVL